MRYNCEATLELNIRGVRVSLTAYGLESYLPPSLYGPEEFDMHIVCVELNDGSPIPARLESAMTSDHWDVIEQALWDYES